MTVETLPVAALLAARIRQLDPQHPNPDLWGQVLAEAIAAEPDACTGPQKHVWLAHQAEQAEARALAAEERCAQAVEQAARATRDLAEYRRVLGRTSR